MEVKKRGRKVRKAKGEFTSLHMVHLPIEVAIERSIPKWLPVGACIRGHWLPRSTKTTCCPMCQGERHKSNPRHYILMRIKESAKRRGQVFNLTVDDIVIPERCPILDIPIEPIASGGFGSGRGARTNSDNGASVDRLDPNKGYVKGNVWVISNKANRMKQDLSVEMLKLMAERVNQQIRLENETLCNS
jgi:hypothetical protein